MSLREAKRRSNLMLLSAIVIIKKTLDSLLSENFILSLSKTKQMLN